MSIHILARSAVMSNDPDVPTVADERRAQAACLRERASLLDDIGAVNAMSIARNFTAPSVHDLQAAERANVDDIAERLALILYGVRTRDSLSIEQRARIECAAQYAVRRAFPVWVRQAQTQAETTLVDAFDKEIPFFAQVAPEKRRELAVITTRLVWAAFIGTLEATTPTNLAAYLRAQAEITEEGGR